MPPLKILLWPNPLLSKVSLPVDVDWVKHDDFKELVGNMTETLIAYNGLGLAAVQIGMLDRLFLMRTREGVQAFVNPVVKEFVDEASMVEESCLSLPGVVEHAVRYPQVILEAYDFKSGETKLWDFYGISAQCVQHEMDHLDGRMLTDRVGPVKRDIIRRKIRKAVKFDPRYKERR